MEITKELKVRIRAPRYMSAAAIERFVLAHEEWARKHIERMRLHIQNHPEPNAEEQGQMRSAAKALLPQLVEKYAAIMGVNPEKVRITSARKRFGSCSGKNSLCFSFRLMEYPREAVEYVVVHELAHIRYKNHSQQFYKYIERFMPDWKRRQKMLRGI